MSNKKNPTYKRNNSSYQARTSSLFTSLLDAYFIPDTVKLQVPPVGEEGLVQDAKSIRGYFQKASEKF